MAPPWTSLRRHSACDCSAPKTPSASAPLSLFIAEVGVADAYLRHGLGRRLMDCLLAEGRRRGCAEAWVATEVDNAPARALYAAAGGELAPERFVVYAWPLGEDSESDESAPR